MVAYTFCNYIRFLKKEAFEGELNRRDIKINLDQFLKSLTERYPNYAINELAPRVQFITSFNAKRLPLRHKELWYLLYLSFLFTNFLGVLFYKATH